MTEVNYTGSRASSIALVNALIDAGYQVVGYTPADPQSATALWVKARDTFPKQAVESGLPRDFRAIITSTGTNLDLVEVPLGATLVVNPQGQLGVRSPSTPVVSPNLSMWRNNASSQPASVFTWDGTAAGFVDLIAFFQLNGSLLERVEIAQAGKDRTVPLLVAKDLATGGQYSFPLAQDMCFMPSGSGKVQGISTFELRQNYTPIGSAELPSFNYTPFAQSVFQSGIELVSQPQPEKKPWYKKWWAWLLIILAVLLLVLAGLIVSQDSEQSGATEDVEVVEVEEPDGDTEEIIEEVPDEQEPPEGEQAPPEGEVEDGAAPAPEPQPVAPPVTEPSKPGIVWPWDDGFKWPWDDGFKWPWSKDDVREGLEDLKEQGLEGLEGLRDRVSGD